MRTYIGQQEVRNASELAELALGFEELPEGIDLDLFRGPLSAEGYHDRAARRDVARAALADLREQAASGDQVAAEDAAYASALMRTRAFRGSRRAGGRAEGGEAA